MKIRKWLFTLCIVAGAAVFAPALAAALSDVSVVTAAETEAGDEDEPPQLQEGWGNDAQGWFFVRDGVRLTRWQTIDGNTYYFDPNGYRVTGPARIKKGKYYVFLFDPETGILCKGRTGLITFSGRTYFLTSSKKGIVSTNRWVKQDGRYYYAGEDGQIQYGTVTVKDKLYHITDEGRMTYYGRSSYDGNYYYAGSNGVLKTGLQKINGKLFCFNSRTGRRRTGTVKIGKYTYYFRTDNGIARTGWVKQKGKYYYHAENGRRLTGWQTINKKKYYLDPDDKGARVQDGLRKISGAYYYFNKSGAVQTGLIKVDGVPTYIANSKGVCQKSWQTVNGRRYYVNKKTYILRSGWITYGGKKYYLNPIKTSSTYGAAKTGWVKLDEAWYYFNSDGSMRTGWLSLDGKSYYLDKSTGKMLTGKHKIDGKVYDFGDSGAYTDPTSGAWRIEVNRAGCFVVVYRGSTEMRAFVCSTAADRYSTPTGIFTIMDKLRWHELNGPSWGQYCSHITPSILFHSVPNTQPFNPHSLNASAYNKLGSPASGGCIRLTVVHAKYIYDNCPIGTQVKISDSVARPKKVTIETAPKISIYQNYDPTDPNI